MVPIHLILHPSKCRNSGGVDKISAGDSPSVGRAHNFHQFVLTETAEEEPLKSLIREKKM